MHISVRPVGWYVLLNQSSEGGGLLQASTYEQSSHSCEKKYSLKHETKPLQHHSLHKISFKQRSTCSMQLNNISNIGILYHITGTHSKSDFFWIRNVRHWFICYDLPTLVRQNHERQLFKWWWLKLNNSTGENKCSYGLNF